ncbi:ShlB/FhaC/HecB family hemolysin secretion/activation protein [Sessilibacter sp. MAH4]
MKPMKSFIHLSCAFITTVSGSVLAQPDFGPNFGTTSDGRLHIINDRDLEEEYRNRALETAGPKNDTNIASVRERDEELRINVKQIQFDRIPSFPELGITEEEILSKVEEWRSELMREEQQGDHGFTADELNSLGNYLASVEALSRPGNLRGENLDGLIELLREQRSKRGISLTGLNEIARRLQNYYQSHGLFLAQVYLPAQDVNNGVVKLAILEGVQGDIVTEGAKKYSTALLEKPFEKNNGQKVDEKFIEEGIYLLNDLPGLRVAGSFSSGKNVGETTLNIDVLDEKSASYAVRVDNHGSTFTGENRLFGFADWNNPFGLGDHISLGVQKSFEPDESELLQFAYDLPVWGVRTRARFGLDYTDFSVVSDDEGLNNLGLSGKNTIISTGLDHKFIRSRTTNLLGSVSITSKETEFTANTSVPLANDHAIGLTLGLVGDRLSSKIRALNAFNVNLSYGNLISDVEEGEPNDYYKFEGTTTNFFFLPIPFSQGNTRLLVKSNWQYSDRPLPSFDQQTLGGAQGVRGYTVRDFTADTAFYLGSEWYLNLPKAINFKFPAGGRLGDYLQTALFYDYAYGLQELPESAREEDTESSVTLTSAGLLFKFNYLNQFSSQLSIAKPVGQSEKINDTLENPDDIQIFADFTYFFK